jgi:thiol-disulfide isomerase/thioredoxin
MMRLFFPVITALLFLRVSAQEAKSIKMPALESYINSSDHPLIINFWATFCAPCVTEIPYLEATARRYKENKVELILVSLDPPAFFPRQVAEFLHRNKLQATIFWLDELNGNLIYPSFDKKWHGGIPATLFVNNATGYRKFFDRQLTEPQVKQVVPEMLNQ